MDTQRIAKAAKSVGAVAGVTIAAVTLVSSPAYADDVKINIVNYDADVWPTGVGYARLYDSHRSVNACDTAADGEGVRSWYIDNNNVHRVVNDGNGHSDGCGSVTLASGTYVTSFRVCLGGEITSTTGCESWHKA